MAPFLTIITRHLPTRPTMFERCKKSLRDQTDQDFEHLVFTNETGFGLSFAQRMVTVLVPEAQGRYVYILDDDDLMVNPNGVALMKAAAGPGTKGILMKTDCLHEGILPRCWPRGLFTVLSGFGAVGQPCYALRKDVFEQNLHAWSGGEIESDQICFNYAYNKSVLRGTQHKDFAVIDEVICQAQRPSSRGRPE